jgi:hypothetical protein
MLDQTSKLSSVVTESFRCNSVVSGIANSVDSCIGTYGTESTDESTELAIPDTTELQRNESVTTDDNFDVWSSIVKFIDKYTKRE